MGAERRQFDGPALLLAAAGGAVRLFASLGPSLGPDEALHLELAGAPDLAGVYRLSLTNAHPPLFFLLLHGWERVARSEWSLRLLSVAFGTAFLWLAWRWASALLGRGAGLLTLSLLAFLPAVALLSAELRAYSLLLLLVAGALFALEQAFETGSTGWLWASTASLCLAMLTHYAALWVALAVFACGAVRLAGRQPAPRFAGAWIACQAGTALLSLFLFGTHVSRLRGGALERQAQAETLRAGYFQPGEEGPFAFVLRATGSVFRFLFGSTAAGAVALALAFGGCVLLAARRRPAALLLALPFVLGAAGGLLRLYPYLGTRHAIYLAPFAAAAIAAGLGRLTGARAWPSLALAAVLLPFCVLAARQAAEEHPRKRMAAAVRELRSTVPAGSVLFSDAGTASVIGYYLGGAEVVRSPADESPGASPGVSRRRAGGYEIVAPPSWTFDAGSFGRELGSLVASGALPSGRPFWLVQADWGFGAAQEVLRAYPRARIGASRRVEEIRILEVEIPGGEELRSGPGRVP